MDQQRHSRKLQQAYNLFGFSYLSSISEEVVFFVCATCCSTRLLFLVCIELTHLSYILLYIMSWYRICKTSSGFAIGEDTHWS